MTTNKLKLKRTPEEEAARQARKERKREKKRKRESAHASTSKRHHVDGHDDSSRKWASSDEEDMEYGPQPAGADSGGAIDYEALKAEIEERRFREKMFDALGDDERIDGLESRFNDFAHVPEHWRSSSTAGLGKSKTRTQVYDEDEFLRMDPSLLDDEEYAEWVRMGMYRKTHAEEHAEQQRKKAERAARKAEDKALRAEAKKMERHAEEEDKLKAERDKRRFEQAREEYHRRWIALLASANDHEAQLVGELTFRDVPWPVVAAYQRRRTPVDGDPGFQLRLEDLSAEAISAFLLPVVTSGLETEEERKKDRKERLREAILRFHPDKFEGRFMKRVKTEEQELVRDAIRQVVGVLNSL